MNQINQTNVEEVNNLEIDIANTNKYRADNSGIKNIDKIDKLGININIGKI